MENIEPWNMFTNEFVAEETDDLLTDEMVSEYATKDNQVAQVKQEPTEEDNDDDSKVRIKEEQSSNGSSHPDDKSNDDKLFNFGVESEIDIAMQHTEEPDDETSGSDQGSHRIDYDSAAIFICPACGLEFEVHDNWKNHIDTVHKFSTRRGLNFVQVDKLYHQCLECKKKIAMHSMENILKHKFTHLPYKRIKCKICLKQYKYRHDLIVHLRMTHRDDLLFIAKAVNVEIEQKNDSGRINFEIKNVQENAIDIFENTVDDVDVRSGHALHMDEDDDVEGDFDRPTSSADPNAINFDESLSRSSSHLSDISVHIHAPEVDQNEQISEKYIQYICPQCGAEFGAQLQWNEHIECVHNFGSRIGLNFKEVNAKQHAQCLQCNKVVYVNVIRNLQLHKFGHLPHKSWLRCKLCFRTFVGQKEIVKHLMTQHRLGEENDAADSQEGRLEGDEDLEDVSAEGLYLEQSREERAIDNFEVHIDYLCPQCGKEFLDKKLWRKHIVKIHHLTDMKVLNFKVLNDRQVSCLECGKIITNAYGVQNAQQHRFTHLPYKSFVRCRLCFKCYTDRKGLVKHLKSRHRIGEAPLQLQTSFSPQSLNHMPVQKEIVQHADYTFEIKYLDDDSDLLDDIPVPELTFADGFDQFASLTCKQCNANFPSQVDLQAHINDEHEFLDFNNLRPLPENPRSGPSLHMQKSSHITIGSTTISKSKRIERPNREVGKSITARHENVISNDSKNGVLASEGNDEASPSPREGGIERNFCYLCPNCGYECATQMLWRRHINDIHNYDKRPALNFRALDKFRYQCQQCMDIVSGSKLKGLQDHKFRHLPFRLYIKCLICGTCYNHKPNMMSHLRQKHNIVDNRSFTSVHHTISTDGTIVDLKSSMKSSSVTPVTATALLTQTKLPQSKSVEDSVTYHNAVDHESIRYFCPQCNENFSTHVHWRKHIVEEHNLNNRQGLNFRQIDEHHFLCLQCYKRVTVTHTKGAIGQLQSHKFRHLPYKSFKCITCNTEFVRKQMFFKHLNKETNLCDSKSMCVEAHRDYQDDRTIDSSSNLSACESSFEGCYILVCPQCGLQFDSKTQWREHINATHDLIRRERLNFKKLTPNVHECMQCFEHINGTKLRDLQVHKFKHLPFGAYIQCRYCIASYHYMRNMYDHLKIKHRHILEKTNDIFEEISFPDYDDNSIEPEEQYLLG